MIIDNELVLSDEQAITASANSTNVLDLNTAERAPGNPLCIASYVNEDFNNLTSLEFKVQSCAVEGFSSGVVDHQKVVVAAADLVKGKKVDLGKLLDGTLQYVRVAYTVTGTNPTTGKVSTMIEPYGSQTMPDQA